MLKMREKLKYYGLNSIDELPQLQQLSDEDRLKMKVVSSVLPFRANSYVVEELIDWRNPFTDPMFNLVFMQSGMLNKDQFDRMRTALLDEKLTKEEVKKVADSIRFEMNVNPAGQLTMNVPQVEGLKVPGIQHKYNETCLVFPAAGQSCHSYCTYCFRWPQFVGMEGVKFATDKNRLFFKYIAEHKEIRDVIFSGGDPMVMSAKVLRSYIEPLLGSEFKHVKNIRIGSKSLTYWPYRYTTDKDADDILNLFADIKKAGKHLAFMAHFTHWREMIPNEVERAVQRIQDTGCVIRTQSPVIARINDDPTVWSDMWEKQIKMGMVPYYFFIARDTGPKQYFSVSISQALDIYNEAVRNLSGLTRTVQGPSMSTAYGKISVEGTSVINGEKVFVMKFLRAREQDWDKKLFYASYDENAIWLDDLKPAFGEEKFFFERS